jgi:hypothetical protein
MPPWGGVILLLSARPLVRLYAEFPDHADTYWKLYPGLFLCALPALCCLAFMFRPIREVMREFPTSATVRALSLALAVGGPLVAVYFEWNKNFVAPWEVLPRAPAGNASVFSAVEAFKVPAGADSYFGRDPVWMRTTEWPAPFFFLKDTAEVLRTGDRAPQMAAPLREQVAVAHIALRRTYGKVFANERLIRGALPMSRTGRSHYFAVGAVALLAAVLLLFCFMLLHYKRVHKDGVVDPGVFTGLLYALVAFALWAVMRQATAVVDEAVFADAPVGDQLIPIALVTFGAFALTFAGLKDQARANFMAGVALVGLFVGPWVAFFTRDRLAVMFGDVRTYVVLGFVALCWALAHHHVAAKLAEAKRQPAVLQEPSKNT